MTRAVGKALAMEIILNDRRLSAQEAQQAGLVNRVVPVASYLEDAITFAAEIAERAPVALRLAKEAIQRGQDLDLDNACLLESKVFGLCFSTADQAEGMAAFVEKRRPRWAES